MLTLIGVLLLLGVILAGMLWAGTLFLQNYLYTTATPGAFWQAPAAAGVMTVFWLIWCLMNALSPDAGGALPPYGTVFNFNVQEEYDKVPVEKLWSVKKGVKEPILYVRQRVGQNRYEYRDTSDKKRTWQPDNVEEILIEDKDQPGQKLHFKRVAAGTGEYRTYVAENGWTMKESTLGEPTVFRYGRFLAVVVLNLSHLALWFLCLWLLLRFQWGHALGLALVLWLVMTFVLGPLFQLAGTAAR